ncbi:MAG: transcription-repair coupling factor, partial [Sediminibacterium sp.]|nr:transcription-repair coupling factor [Sediminibacterium sp.]
HLINNQQIDLWDLKEYLDQHHFIKEDFVQEPGQYALRGNIIDLYSYNSYHPLRLEWALDKLISIRQFSLENQISVQNVDECWIFPNAPESLPINLYNLTAILKPTDIIWCANFMIFKERFLALYQEMFNESGLDIISNILKNKHIFYGSSPELEQCTLIELKSQPQPEFHLKFDLLCEDLLYWKSLGYTINIFFDQEKQIQRLEQIFIDIDKDISYNAIPFSIHDGFIDHQHKIVCYTEHQIFQRFHKHQFKRQPQKSNNFSLKQLQELQPGDYVVHQDHGIGRFSGLQKIEINGKKQEVIRLIYKNDDILYVGIQSLFKISKYAQKDGVVPQIHKLGSEQWVSLKEKAKKKIKTIAFDLIKLYAERKSKKGFAFGRDNYIQAELEAGFIYEETPDQEKAIIEVKNDMEQSSPMDRLICGDVGFGKTEIAIRAAFKAVLSNKQVAVLVPTTILALQHYKTFFERCKNFAIDIDFLNRFRTAKEKKEICNKLASGKIDIIIGTHGILAPSIKYKDLGLLIIDEEHKFGVSHKEIIKTLKVNVDCLTLTATPIPRTLQFSLMGARDISIIHTPPPNRQPIHTEIISFNEQLIKKHIESEVERGGQVFFIQNKISGMEELLQKLEFLCPKINFIMAHGQLEGNVLEKRILAFIEKKYDVLVATNIVESGLDISNVNTIFINEAHHFGLSDLHQLRGRVGRSNSKAYCYLVVHSIKLLSPESQQRLEILERFTDLGSGFQIAIRDLDLRGAGDILGAEQSGFVNDLGFDTYQKILKDALRELKNNDLTNIAETNHSKNTSEHNWGVECTIDADAEILIPNNYIENETERFKIYTRLNNSKNIADLQNLKTEIVDRFGSPPPEIHTLWEAINVQLIAQRLGIDRILFKEKMAKCYFIKLPHFYTSQTFNCILQFLQHKKVLLQLKQSGHGYILILFQVLSFSDLKNRLAEIEQFKTQISL